MKIRFAILSLLLAISCTKQNVGLHETVAQSQDNSVAAHHVGERYGGGIIFYIDSTGQHGLIADTVDAGAFTWWNGQFTLTGATGKYIGQGQPNTKKIIKSEGKTGHYAALRCHRDTTGGYTDWFLPSAEELSKLYKQRSVVGGFEAFYYWSSTEGTEIYANAQWFEGGARSLREKNYEAYVRPIRAF